MCMTCILGTTYIAEFDPLTLIAVSPDLWPPTGLTLGGEYGHRSRYLSQATNSYVAYFWRATYLCRSIFDWASVLEHNQNCCCVFWRFRIMREWISFALQHNFDCFPMRLLSVNILPPKNGYWSDCLSSSKGYPYTFPSLGGAVMRSDEELYLSLYFNMWH